ncbi:MAG TPA: uroporphyrinogen-III synthase [Burkholderiales bacterium]|nr:uroporphyrinogen-III synthase [Burkholderiales bacterium]
MYLVISPDGQLDQLINYLQKDKIKAIPIPLMNFIINQKNIKQLKDIINDFEYVIFNSPTAIHICSDVIKNATYPTFLTVGEASAIRLKGLTTLPIIYPLRNSGADNLFEEKLKYLDFKNKKILIVKGVGGSNTLKKKLSLIKANWQEIDIYIRNKKYIDVSFIKKSLTSKELQGIIITSSILVEWLFSNAKEHDYLDILLNKQFFTIHNNIAEKLLNYGVSKVFISNKADQYSLVNLVKEFSNDGSNY